MKHKKLFRSVTALLAALVLMGGFSVTAFAGGGDVSDEPPTPVTETEPEETTGGYEPQPLTPEGNMSLVDDIKGEASGDKQFITVVTKNGNYFYIIIDRAEDGENTVHFLNQVDEADLTALMEEEQTESPACSCTKKCVAGIPLAPFAASTWASAQVWKPSRSRKKPNSHRKKKKAAAWVFCLSCCLLPQRAAARSTTLRF